MSDEDLDALAELDVQVVTVTRDSDGVIAVDGGDAQPSEVVFMLDAARFLLLQGHFFGDGEEDDDDD